MNEGKLKSNSRERGGNDAGKDEAAEERIARLEEEEVYEKAAASAEIVYRAILKEAEEELERHWGALACSGLAAGLSMGFSLVAEGLLQSRLPSEPWRDLIVNLGYTFGFLVVILGRQQLFTENTLTPIMPLLKRRDRGTLMRVLRLWGIILVCNLAGAIVVAFALAKTPAFSEVERGAFLEISLRAMAPTVGAIFVKSIFAGWLIALMVWLLPVAETARIWVTIIVPYLVGIGALSHIVIGTVYCAYSIAAGQHSWMQYVEHFALPTLAGNIIGGVTMVAVVNYGQATAGKNDPA